MIKRVRIPNLRDIVKTELHSKGRDVALKMLSLGAANDWEDVRSLQHDVRNGNLVQGSTFARSDGLQYCRDLAVRVCDDSITAALRRLVQDILLLELALSDRSPRSEAHPFIERHGDDVALEVTLRCIPQSLVKNELA